MTKILGVDPGLEGALAVVEADQGSRLVVISLLDIPTMGEDTRRRVNGTEVARWVREQKPDEAWFEQINPMREWGVSSTARFFEGIGTLLGVLQSLDIPIRRVRAQDWKKTFGLGREKEDARRRVIELHPRYAELFNLKKHHQRAEAVLIALHGHEATRG